MKLLTVTLALLLLILSSCHLQAAMAGSDICDSQCKVRCDKSQGDGHCLKYCSGTYGNKDECRDKVTKDGKKKPKRP